ncbi:MAG: aldo/keto reductase [Pseudomonadota bacterium]|nr:aldo/keto reductase [Pseudomonadota bacterium]
MERRSVLRGVVGGGLAAGLAGQATAAQPSMASAGQADRVGSAGQVPAGSAEEAGAPGLPLVQNPGELRGEMLYRPLGRTGEMVSAIGLGGSHIAKPPITKKEATHLMHEAIDRGITFMDNCWDYNEHRSLRWMGDALAEGGYRNKVFVMSKIDGRTKEVAADQINDCLTWLRTDHIDLMQHHEVLRYDDPDRIFGEGGAMEAVVEAQKAGKIRHIGFTGHKDPRIHLYMLEVAGQHGFRFDTVQMPLNVMDAHYRSFAHLVLPHLVQQQIGVLGMKSMGSKIILKSGVVSAPECLQYALSLPTSVVITGIDNQQVLDQAFKVAKEFRPLDRQQLAALLSKTEKAAQGGTYELFKISAHFDETARHPDWMGEDRPAVQRLAPELPG